MLGLIAISSAGGLGVLTAGFLVSVVGQNMAGAAYQAMMPDLVPQPQWGMASGYMGVAGLLGTMTGLGLAGICPLGAVYWVMAFVCVAGAVYTAGAIREEPWPQGPVRKTQIRSNREFRLVFAARFLVMFRQALLMTFVLYFYHDVLARLEPCGQHCADRGARAARRNDLDAGSGQRLGPLRPTGHRLLLEPSNGGGAAGGFGL